MAALDRDALLLNGDRTLVDPDRFVCFKIYKDAAIREERRISSLAHMLRKYKEAFILVSLRNNLHSSTRVSREHGCSSINISLWRPE